MRYFINFLALCALWHSAAFADIKIKVVDESGQAIPNAVVSIPLSGLNTPSNSPILDAAESAVMDQVNKQFSPHVLLVDAGQLVTFPNSDQVRHHVYSFSKPNDFEIRLYSGNQVEPLSFNHPGVVVLGCNIHDQMVGYLYIQKNEVAQVSDNKGYVSFDDDVLKDSLSDQVVTIWHSQLSNNKTERITRLLSEKNEEGEWLLTLTLIPEVKKSSRKFKLRY